MKQSSEHPNEILKLIADNKVWALMLPVFAACLWFAVTFYIHAPGEWSSLNARRTRLDNIQHDAQVVQSMSSTEQAALEASKTAHIAYSDFVDAVKQEQKFPDAAVIDSTYQVVADATSKVSAAMATMESARSSNAAVDQYAQQFAADLQTYPPMLAEMGQTLQLVQKGDQAAALKRVEGQSDMMLRWPIYLQVTESRLNGFSAVAAGSQGSNVVEEQSLKVDTQGFYVRLFLSIAATMFVIGYGVLLGRRLTAYYGAGQGKAGRRRRRKR